MIVRGENVPEHRRHSRTFSAMTEPRWLTDTEQRAWRAYLDSTRLLLQALDRELVEDSALSLTDYELLVRLSEAPARRLRMRELANTALATRSGVTRAVTRLEEAGWVRRSVCEDDRRGMNAELTDTGQAKLADAAPGHVAAVRTNMIDLLSARDLESVRSVGARMRKHLQAASEA